MVQRAVQGDQRAVEWIMRRYNRRLYRFARGVLGEHADAVDSLQEAYLCAFRGLRRLRAESSLETWLTRIVRNECLALRRKSRRREHVVPMMSIESLDRTVSAISDESEEPDRSAARAQINAILERRVDELPAPLRVVFVLRSIEELSVEETARCLDISAETVRTRHLRARQHLQRALAGDIDTVEPSLYDFAGAECDSVVKNVLARLYAPAAILPSIRAS